jgi:hypothetical protein
MTIAWTILWRVRNMEHLWGLRWPSG